MTDDELERLLRDANPAQTPLGSPATSRQRLVMAQIMAEPEPRRAWRSARFGVPLAVLVASALVLIAFFNPLTMNPAVAYGPPVLTYKATTDSLQEVVRGAEARLSTQAGLGAPTRRSIATSWRLTVQDDGGLEPVTFISPLITNLSWYADLSGRRTLVAGEAYALGDESAADAPSPGTVIADTVFDKGEYQPVTPDASRLGLDAVRELMHLYAAPTSSTPGEAMWAAADLLNEWSLTNAQHSYLLQTLLEYDNLTVLGTTHDRAGRPVVGIQGATLNGSAATLLVSVKTGRIVSFETSVTSKDSSLPVPPGTVTSYTLWKEAQ